MTLARLSDNNISSLPSLFERLLDGDLVNWNLEPNTSRPAVNIRETKDHFSIELAAPGMNKEDFGVDYENGQLTISATKKEEDKENEDEFLRREYCYHSFQKTFNVSEDMVNTDKIHAKYENGILSVLLPKKQEAKEKSTKKIKIT